MTFNIANNVPLWLRHEGHTVFYTFAIYKLVLTKKAKDEKPKEPKEANPQNPEQQIAHAPKGDSPETQITNNYENLVNELNDIVHFDYMLVCLVCSHDVPKLNSYIRRLSVGTQIGLLTLNDVLSNHDVPNEIPKPLPYRAQYQQNVAYFNQLKAYRVGPNKTRSVFFSRKKKNKNKEEELSNSHAKLLV